MVSQRPSCFRRMPAESSVFVELDGVYRNSEVWINDHYLGKRPYGYSSFAYELTPHWFYGRKPNVIAVKVDNSQQPNSRWYSGSGIYRNVWLTTLERVHVEHWGTYVTTPEVNSESATVVLKTKVRNGSKSAASVNLTTIIQEANGREVARGFEKAVSQAEYKPNAESLVAKSLVRRTPVSLQGDNAVGAGRKNRGSLRNSGGHPHLSLSMWTKASS